MIDSTVKAAAAPSAALAAFLRGIERRGAVFAELQCGDGARGDTALAETMAAFRPLALELPVAAWGHRFWALLLASPRLRDPLQAAQWPEAFAAIGRLRHGPRATLLLRLVAGLAEADAAAVLGIARPTYRLALQRALPRHVDGTPDQATWRDLHASAQQAVRALPVARMAQLARVREGAIATPDADAPPGRSRAAPWMLPGCGAVAVAMGLALAATGRAGPDPAALAGPPGAGPRIVVRALRESPPAARFDQATALLSHRDLDQLLDEQSGSVHVAAADPAFHAWLAARDAAARGADEAVPVALVDPASAATSPAQSADGRADRP